MTRSELRDNIFKMLFRVEFHEAKEMEEQLSIFQEDLEHLESKDEEYIREKTNSIIEKLSEIDEKINDKSVGWKTSRMSKMDLSILRLATYEILYDEDVPNAVAINEAVELAKKYGTDDSKAFVNGILAKIV